MRQLRLRARSVMVGVQVEIRDTQHAALAAGGVGDAPRPDSGVGDDHLRIVGGHDPRCPQLDRLDLPVDSAHLNPIPRLIAVFQYGYESGNQAAYVVLERKGERQTYAGNYRNGISEGGLDKDRDEDDQSRNSDQKTD